MTVLYNLSPVKTATQGRFKELYLKKYTFSFFHGLLRIHLINMGVQSIDLLHH